MDWEQVGCDADCWWETGSEQTVSCITVTPVADQTTKPNLLH